MENNKNFISGILFGGEATTRISMAVWCTLNICTENTIYTDV